MYRAKRSAVSSGDRSDIHDDARTLLQHLWDNCFRRKERARRVKVDDLVPAIFRHLECLQTFDERAGIVDENIDRTEAALHLADHAVDLGIFCDVRFYRNRRTAATS